MTSDDLIKKEVRVLLETFKEEEAIVSFFEKLLEKGDFKGTGPYFVAVKALVTRKVYESVNCREIPARINEYLWYRCKIDRAMVFYYLERYKPTKAYYILDDLYKQMFFVEPKEYLLNVSLDLRRCSVLDRDVLLKFLSLCLVTGSLEKYSLTDVLKLLEKYGKVTEVSV